MTFDVDLTIASVLRAAGIDPTPPIDVVQLAQALGVDSITVDDLLEDGRVCHGPSGTHIYVSEHINRARRRFTLAHELGHILLADPAEPLMAERSLPVRSNEERLCDEIAAAILMPRSWLRSSFADRSRTLANARLLANTAITSLAASVVRLNQVLDWRRAFIRWRWRDGAWRLAAAAGVPPGLHGTITTAPETRAVLDRQRRQKPHECVVELPLQLGGGRFLAPASLEVHPRSAFALVDLCGAPAR
jgi:hypothetical protein